jgi:OOP family OmpA-OmpF porin
MRKTILTLIALALTAVTFTVAAQPTTPRASATVLPAFVPQPGQVVVSGTVPDERTKSEVLRKLQNLYGVANVIDQIDVRSDVVAPKEWSRNVVNHIVTGNLRDVHRGQLEIDGTQVRISGEVDSEQKRQSIVNQLASSLNQDYRIASALRVVIDEQQLLDRLLAGRIVEFHVASAELTRVGMHLLDELADVLPRINSGKITIIGHTDSTGQRATNIALSLARAESVKQYFVEKGLSPARFITQGVGPDQPVASNNTADGRAKNRRIEFRASN